MHSMSKALCCEWDRHQHARYACWALIALGQVFDPTSPCILCQVHAPLDIIQLKMHLKGNPFGCIKPAQREITFTFPIHAETKFRPPDNYNCCITSALPTLLSS